MLKFRRILSIKLLTNKTSMRPDARSGRVTDQTQPIGRPSVRFKTEPLRASRNLRAVQSEMHLSRQGVELEALQACAREADEESHRNFPQL